jgi:hypothetical protein
VFLGAVCGRQWLKYGEGEIRVKFHRPEIQRLDRGRNRNWSKSSLDIVSGKLVISNSKSEHAMNSLNHDFSFKSLKVLVNDGGNAVP